VQERQFTRSESEPSAARRTSAWLAGLAAAAGTASLALFSVGCPQPADLQDPQQYPLPGGSSGGSTTGGSATAGTTSGGSATGGSGGGATCETPCMATVITTCKTCHGAALKSSDLDLEAAGYTARLKDVPAKHGGLMGAPACPMGDKLIDSANPAESWLLKKVSSQEGDCGDPMPQGTGLAGDQLKCVQDYVSCVATGGT
jgi:hypothetical protein